MLKYLFLIFRVVSVFLTGLWMTKQSTSIKGYSTSSRFAYLAYKSMKRTWPVELKIEMFMDIEMDVWNKLAPTRWPHSLNWITRKLMQWSPLRSSLTLTPSQKGHQKFLHYQTVVLWGGIMPRFHSHFCNLRDVKLTEVPKDRPRLEQREPPESYTKHTDHLIYVNERKQIRSAENLENWETDHHHNEKWRS